MKHPTLETLTELLEKVWWAEAVKDLENPVGEYVLLPMWSWGQAPPEVGRKAIAPTGYYEFPIRYIYSSPPIVPLAEVESVQWKKINGSSSGTVSLQDDDPRGIQVVSSEDFTALKELGNDAYWGIIKWARPIVMRWIHKEHHSLCHEIAEFHNREFRMIMDSENVEAVYTDLVLGTGDEPSVFRKSILRALRDEGFAKVDPLRWINVNLKRDIQQAFRYQAGDSRIGRKARQIAKELNSIDPTLVTKEHRRRHPYDKATVNVINRALTIGDSTMNRKVHYTDF